MASVSDLLKTIFTHMFLRFRRHFPRKLKLIVVDIIYKISGRRITFPYLMFEVHITDKCNLKCAGCGHFSSLSDVGGSGNLLDVESYEKDLKRISELMNGKIGRICLLGGEPLLHPYVKDFFTITRKYLPEINKSEETGIVQLVTNGILLHEQPDDFWEACRKNNIVIVISDYPVNIRVETIKDKALKFNVGLKFLGEELLFREAGSANRWTKIPIDLSGLQDNRKSFGKCYSAGVSFQLVNGKIFKCARIAFIDYFNTAFNKNLTVGENDYADIYKVKDGKELLRLLTEPASFCRYCKTDSTTWNNEWKVSNGLIEEWI